MKELFFIRNSVIIISHDDIIKNKKEIAEALKDLNLSIAKNFDWMERDNFIIYTHLLKKSSYSEALKYYKIARSKIEYVGSKASDLMFYIHRNNAIHLFICRNSSIYVSYYVNRSNIVIDLDDEYETFTDDEIRRLISYSDQNIQKLKEIENVDFVNESVYDESVVTPIVIKYKENKTIIGFLHFTKISWKPMIVFHLSEDILKDRNVLGKLLCYFINIESFDLNPETTEQKEICINFNKRNRKELASDKINVDHDAVYNRIFKRITIGSDFEFSFIDGGGNTVHAYDIIDDYLRYIYLPDYEEEYEEEIREIDKSRRIGVDGNHKIGECRTDVYYADKDGYRGFIKEIEELIMELENYADYNNCFVTFSNEYYSTGFHLHLGFEEELINDEKSLVASNFALLLDLSLASYLYTLNTKARLSESYSEFNNIEFKSYGFEYRSIPSTVLYNGLYKYVIEIYYKLIEQYFYKSYFCVEMSPDGKLSRKFFKKLLGKNTKKYFDLINELRESLRKKVLYVDYPSLNAKTLYIKNHSLYNSNDYFTLKFKDFIVDLNINYVKNGIVYFYGLKKERGNNVNTLEHSFPELPEFKHYYYSNVPYLDDFVEINFGIARNLREAVEQSEEMYYLSELIYKLLKELEKNKILVGKSEEVFKKLCEKYGFNVEVIEKVVA